MRILVAEDERFLADLVADGLRERTMAVDVAYDGAAALDRLAVHEYDVLVLDRDLPHVHGDEICRELAQREEPVRILMLTASDAVHDRVTGLNLGADDYLAKPFAFDELVARVRALGRRARPPLPPVLECGGIVLDTGRRQAHREGRYLPLSRKEYAVLEVLMQARGIRRLRRWPDGLRVGRRGAASGGALRQPGMRRLTSGKRAAPRGESQRTNRAGTLLEVYRITHHSL